MTVKPNQTKRLLKSEDRGKRPLFPIHVLREIGYVYADDDGTMSDIEAAFHIIAGEETQNAETFRMQGRTEEPREYTFHTTQGDFVQLTVHISPRDETRA